MAKHSNPYNQQQFIQSSNPSFFSDMQSSQTSSQTSSQNRNGSQFSQDNILAVTLKFDSEMKQNLHQVLEKTELSLYQLVMKAVTYYIKFALHYVHDNIALIATDKLLFDPSFKTYPGRAEELTRRAIKAIETHNQKQPQKPWAITQSIIVTLIKARPASVRKALIPFQQEIEAHNHYYGVDGYSNRNHKETVTDAIDLVKLVPDGII